MRIWLLCLLLIGSQLGGPAWGQATTPVGNPLELREALAPLDAHRIPMGFLLNRLMLFTDPTRLAGQDDTAASFRGFEQQ